MGRVEEGLMESSIKEINNLLTEFLICEIGRKALDGITYTMVVRKNENKDIIDRYMAIANKVREHGYKADEIFRVFEVSNGYIFDMDLNTAKKITSTLAKAVGNTDGVTISNPDLIGDKPEVRRKRDMMGLAKYVKDRFDSGSDEVEVALFSRNSIPRITITGKDTRNNLITVKYNAYAIRHWDIETINLKILIPAGIRIARLEPYDIMPRGNGVRFKLYLEAL